MICCIRRNWHGANDPDPFGYQLVAKIRSFFIKGPVTKDAKNRSWGFLTMKVIGKGKHSPNYRTLLSAPLHLFQPEEIEGVLNVVDKRVTLNMNASLLQRYTPKEVRKALFQMHPSKSPSPNSMSPFFFQKFLHIVGHDVTTAILSVLNSGHMLSKMNHTHIVLIPKKNGPTTWWTIDPLA